MAGGAGSSLIMLPGGLMVRRQVESTANAGSSGDRRRVTASASRSRANAAARPRTTAPASATPMASLLNRASTADGSSLPRRCRTFAEKAKGEAKMAESLFRSSFTDMSSFQEVTKPARTYRDYEKEEQYRRSLISASTPLGTSSLTKDTYTDLSGHTKALRPCATVYTQKEELRKERETEELRQLRTRRTGKGLRPGGLTQYDNLRSYSVKEMVDCQTAPTFTGWHEYIEPIPAPWQSSMDATMRSTFPRSRLRRTASAV
eukprot:TRINITY_DN4575_c0_g4_i1.p1 TRINITY_DN4575_c0_g4~~TRINITY_DN4575_c0_g4_i1.p1  ORF type:complete len:261 (-),score=41.18 TRINITY_DN4575_c0_g4_i1:139-921(-)